MGHYLPRGVQLALAIYGKNYDAFIVLEDDGTRSTYKLDFTKEDR